MIGLCLQCSCVPSDMCTVARSFNSLFSGFGFDFPTHLFRCRRPLPSPPSNTLSCFSLLWYSPIRFSICRPSASILFWSLVHFHTVSPTTTTPGRTTYRQRHVALSTTLTPACLNRFRQRKYSWILSARPISLTSCALRFSSEPLPRARSSHSPCTPFSSRSFSSDI